MNNILNKSLAATNSQSIAPSPEPATCNLELGTSKSEPGTSNLLALHRPAKEEQLETSRPARRSRRNGKIAGLPKKLRDLVNESLADGATYAQIVRRLKESTDPPLPYEIFEKNISTWHGGGYQDWLRHQDRMELIVAKLDFALDLARNSHPEKIQELSLQLAAMRLSEFLSDLAIADPQTDPMLYLRLLSALPRISREALNIQKYRDAATAQKPSQAQHRSEQHRAEACRTAFLDQMDDLMGLKSYRDLPFGSADAPAGQSPSGIPLSQPMGEGSRVRASDLSVAIPMGEGSRVRATNPPVTPSPHSGSTNPPIQQSNNPAPHSPPTDTSGHPQTPAGNLRHLPTPVPDKPAACSVQPAANTHNWPEHCLLCCNRPLTDTPTQPLPYDCQLCPLCPRPNTS